VRDYFGPLKVPAKFLVVHCRSMLIRVTVFLLQDKLIGVTVFLLQDKLIGVTVFLLQDKLIGVTVFLLPDKLITVPTNEPITMLCCILSSEKS